MQSNSPLIRNRRLFSPQHLERLESRLFLHAGHFHSLAELGIPDSLIQDGHIRHADFVKLAPEIQAQIDPHAVEEEIPDGPIIYDDIFGIPQDATGRLNPEADTFPDWYPAVNGSITLDQTSQSGRTLVKFPTAINNQGTGPGIGISGRPGVDPIPTGAPISSWLTPDGGQAVLQPIYSFNGTSFVLDHYRNGGSFTYHNGHGHFHFDGYNYYRLRQNVGGQPGPYVQRPDGTDIVGEKVGFCLINVGSSFTMENGQSSTTLPGYNAGGQPSTGCGFTQGVHVGKYDQYGSGTGGQWLDVTGVPNGNYFLEITVDGENVLQETNENNNTKNFGFTLNVNPPSGGITPDQFDTGTNNDSFDKAVDRGVMGTAILTGLTTHWGQDYDFFKFAASSSGTATITLTPANGDVNLFLYDANQVLLGSSTNPSGSDSVSYNFVAGQTYYVKTQTYNSSLSSNYQIAWNLKPTVEAATPDSLANEFGTNFGLITLARNGPVDSPLTVNFNTSGDAIRGTDYRIFFDGIEVTGNSVIIGSSTSQANLEIRPIYDNIPEPAETATINLTTASAYVVGGASSGSVTIGDAGPEVSQSTHIWQTSPHKLVFDIDRALASSVGISDFQVVNLDTSQTVTGQSLSTQDFGSFVRATINFGGVMPDARYRVNVAPSSFVNSLGDPNFSAFSYDFFYLTADANHDGFVTLNDFNALAANFGQNPRDASQGDFNFDGMVDISDFNLFAARFGSALAAPQSTSSLANFNGGRTFGGIFADGKGIDEDGGARLEQLA